MFKKVIETLQDRLRSDWDFRETTAPLKRKRLGGADSPWVAIPNIRDFKITLRPYDFLLQLFGINKKLNPELTFEMYDKSNKMNRFMIHQIRRLRKWRSNSPRMYFAIARILMKRSNVLRVIALNHVMPQWHRKYSFPYVLMVNRKVSEIINKNWVSMDFKRIYIPKGTTKFRPLGVPKMEWRMYLHMVNQFLMFYLRPSLSRRQHGFITGRGCLTAWKDIFSNKLLDKPYIREWDFKGYFDSIFTEKITAELEARGIPSYVSWFLEMINNSKIDLPPIQDHLLDESQNMDIIEHLRNFYWQGEDEDNVVADLMTLVDELGPEGDEEMERLRDTTPRGVAQGAPTSPILANVIMDLWIRENESREIDCVAYADDSVSFSYGPIDPEIPKFTGIQINEEKSGYVKYEGRWLKPLKFLGFIWNPETETWESETRKGAKLTWDRNIDRLVTVDTKVPIDNLELLTEYLEGFKEEDERISLSDLRNTRSQLEDSLTRAISRLTQLRELAKNNSSIDDTDTRKWESIITDINRKLKDNGNAIEQKRRYEDKLDSFNMYAKSRLFGFITSRMYLGKWNLNITQDFSNTFVRGSWMDTKLVTKHPLSNNIFLSSTFACKSLLNVLRWNQKIRTTRRSSGGRFKLRKK